MDVADGQRQAQLAPARFGQEALVGALSQPAQLGFTDGALQPEQQAVVEQTRIINAVGIDDDGVGQAAQLEELMPVAVVAREARDFETEDRAGAAQTDIRDEALKPGATGGRGVEPAGSQRSTPSRDRISGRSLERGKDH